jgi:hemolysin D
MTSVNRNSAHIFIPKTTEVDNFDLVSAETAAKAEAVSKGETSLTSIDRFRQDEFSEDSLSEFTSITQYTFSRIHDWSDSAKELIDTMPLAWTQGLLYGLVAFICIFIPWACLYRMDEIGTARGRLEYRGSTIKREADIDGSVAVIKVHVKKGDRVKVGQTIMELDSKNVREQISQNQLKLDGEQQRLNQLILMRNQIGLGTNAQQQQNQAQLLEKQSQIAQSEQNFTDRQSSYKIQKAEKLTQVRQAQQAIVDAQTSYLLSQHRLKDAQNEVNRYRQLYRTGAIPEVNLKEVESVAQEKNQIFSQAVATLQQSKLRIKEQQENYRKIIQQAQSDIEQAKLRFTEQQRGAESLAKGGNIAILKTDQQLKEIQSQIVTLKAEIERDRGQNKFLTGQLDKYTIKADTDGTIFELPIGREGAVVQPKQLIAEIASTTKGLVFKGEIPADQSESLRSSTVQKDVKLKFDEFPFESYDIVPGKLTWIAPNSKLPQTTERTSTNTTSTNTTGTASYEIEVQLAQSCVKHEGNCIPFKSGQPATAEVSIRNRRIIDFILDPFKKLANNGR